MSLMLVVEMWSVVKDSIISSDRSMVADNIVTMLIDNDVSADDVRRAFRGEGVVIDALKSYIDSDVDEWTEDDNLDIDIDYIDDDNGDDDNYDDENW